MAEGTPPNATDVCVVGGGLGGLSAAITAARGGLDITLVERATYPRPKVCGGCLNNVALGVLDRLGVTPRLGELSELSEIELRTPRRVARVPMAPGLGVTRGLLDRVVSEVAAEAGVHLLTGTIARVEPAASPDARRLVGLRPALGGQAITVRAKLVIAAEGLARSAHAPNREMPHTVSPHSRIGIGIACEGRPPADGITMAVTRHGYVGVAAAERGLVSVAGALDAPFLREAGSPHSAALRILRDTQLDWGADLPAEGWLATPALTRRTHEPVAWRMVEAGDACGYVEPFTGEGMAWALTGGELAGRHARLWCEDPAAALAEWPRLLREMTGPRKRVCRTVAWTLRRPRLVDASIGVLRMAPVLGRLPMLGTSGRGSIPHTGGDYALKSGW